MGLESTWIKHVDIFVWMSLFYDFMFIFKQQFQALHKKKILTTTACALLNILAAGGAKHHISDPANDYIPHYKIQRHPIAVQVEIMSLSGDN